MKRAKVYKLRTRLQKALWQRDEAVFEGKREAN